MGSVLHIPVAGRKINKTDYHAEHLLDLDAADIEAALGYVPADAADIPPPVDLAPYATDAELAAGLATKSDTSHTHDTRYYTEAEVDALLAAKANATLIALMADAMPLTFNFTAAGEVRFYADEAMTLTQQATSGTGTIAYEKSTAGAPGTFGATTSPITLEAGAWLKVVASAVTTIIAVHLKRTA